jgi:HAD superfamily hydrolase (TIGR01509 family)
VPRAILFDVDGTLVDSVDLHARAWQEGFAHFGKELSFEEVRSQIGKGGDQLLATFLDDDEQEAFGDDLERYRSRLFKSRYLPWARAFPHARELVRRVKAAGLGVALATSAKQEELDHHLQLIGIEGLVDAWTTADEVERSKPFPDVFERCVAKLGVAPADCVAVGDSPFDALSARRAGIHVVVGILAGGFPARALREAGCAALYAEPADLLARFELSPLARWRDDEHAPQ